MRKLGGQVDRATEGLARLDWLDWLVSGDEGRRQRQRRASPPEPRGGVQYPNGTQKGGDAALVNCSDELANASSGPCVAMKVLNPSPLTPGPVRRLFSFPSRSHLLFILFRPCFCLSSGSSSGLFQKTPSISHAVVGLRVVG